MEEVASRESSDGFLMRVPFRLNARRGGGFQGGFC